MQPVSDSEPVKVTTAYTPTTDDARVHVGDQKLPAKPVEVFESDDDGSCNSATKPRVVNEGVWASLSPPQKGAIVGLIAVVVVATAVIAGVFGSGSGGDGRRDGDTVTPVDKHNGPLIPSYAAAEDGSVADPAELVRSLGSLRLVSFLPTSGQISFRQAITLVFSKSVIALGSNFDSAEHIAPADVACNGATSPLPGKWRWVTTSIARFDPDIDWPTDLKCTVTPKANLVSWDGSSVSIAPADARRAYSTTPLQVSISSIESTAATALTENTWHAWIGNQQVPEIPQDAQISLGFTADVDVVRAASLIRVFENGALASGKSFIINGSCGGSATTPTTHTSCIRGYISGGGVSRGARVELRVEPGATLTRYGGPTTAPLVVAGSGLLPFKFDFVYNEWEAAQISSRNLRMYLRHGLKSSVSALAASISVKVNGVDAAFTADKPSSYELLLRVPTLAPATPFTITVAANGAVLDGFDQPLQASSQAFRGGDVRGDLIDLARNRNVLFPSARAKSADSYALFGRQSALSGSQNGGTCTSTPVATFDALTTSIPIETVVSQYGVTYNWVYPYTAAKQSYSVPSSTGPAFISVANSVATLVNATASRVAIREFNTAGCYTNGRTFILGTDTALTVIATPGRLTVFASNLFTAAAVAGVSVKTVPLGGAASTTITTDANGVATFDFSASTNYISLSVIATSPDGSVSIARDISVAAINQQTFITATSDRGIYNLRDQVYVTGVVRTKRDGVNSLEVPKSGTTIRATIQWTEGTSETISATTTRFGTFALRLTVPPNADYTTRTVQLNTVDIGGYGSLQFAIADPRVPTAVLKLAPSGNKVQLESSTTFPVTVTTATYSGQAIANSEISFTVRITGLDGSTRLTTSHTKFTSNDGTVAFNVPLVGQSGESATITASWVGPTRELLVQTLSVPIRRALVVVNAERENVARAVPGVPYNIKASVDASDEPNPSTLPLTRQVTVELYKTKKATPVAGRDTRFFYPSIENLYVRDGDQPVSTSTCALAASGKLTEFANLCPVTLPAVGVFVVVVKSADSLGNVANATIFLGEPRESWEQYPLTGPYPIVARFGNAGTYSRGSNIDVVLTNPYTFTAKALYMCSDSSTPLQFAPVPPGTSSIVLPPSTCDCPRVSMTILTPESATPVDPSSFPVPISATTDFSAPTHFDWSLQPNCAEASPSVKVVVQPATASTTPGSTVSADVVTTDADGKPVEAEVTIMLVDKAILDLNAPTTAQMSLTATPQANAWRGGYFYGGLSDWRKMDQRDDYISPSYIAAMRNRVPHVASLDPWRSWYELTSPAYIHANATKYALSSRASVTPFPYVYVPELPFGYATYGGDANYAMEAAMDGAGGAMPKGGLAAQAPSAVARDTKSSTSAMSDDGSNSNSVHIRGDYQPTAAAFKVVTDATTGKASISLPLNSNVGTWVVRVVAVRASGNRPIATSTTEIVARKPLQIVASTPRVVRYGDTFYAGVVASATAPTTATVTLIKMCAGLELAAPRAGGSLSWSVQLGESTPVEVLYYLRAAAYDKDCTLTFTATATVAGASVSDGISVSVPVLAALPPVSIGTSFVLRDSQAWSEGLAYPRALPGGRVGITVSVGRLAAIEAIARSMLKRHAEQSELYAPDHLDRIAAFVALYPYATGGSKIVTDSLIASAQLSATFNETRIAFLQSVAALQDFTSDNYGLRYTRRQYQFAYVDLMLNLRALHTFRFVLPAGAGNSIPNLYASGKITTLLATWEAAVVAALQQLVQYPPLIADPYLSAQLYYSYGSALSTQLRSGPWMGTIVVPWAQLVVSASTFALDTGATIFSTMVREGYSLEVQRSLAQQFLDQIRVTGRTAFIAQTGSGNAPSERTTAIILSSLTAATAASTVTIEPQLIEKLCNYVSQTEKGAFGSRWAYFRGGDEERALALSSYDLAHRVTNPNLDVAVQNGTAILRTVKYHGTSSIRHVDTQSYPFATLSKPVTQDATSPSGLNSSLQFTSIGSGEASVVLSLDFVPELPRLNTNRYFGLFVEKTVQIISGANAGKLLNGTQTPLAPGDMVKVTLAVTTPDDVQSFKVTDFCSGGLEPVNAQLSGMANILNEATQLSNGGTTTGGSSVGGGMPDGGAMFHRRAQSLQRGTMPSMLPWYPWWTWFFRFSVEVARDQVQCVGYGPSAGTYECVYFATATTSGDFVVPPAQAVVINQPEVMGLSKYSMVRVDARRV